MKLKSFSLNYGTTIFKALADESRIRILNLIITQGEMCISDLEIILEFTQTKTSRHISYLKNSGIVEARKEDQWVFYSIKDEVSGILQNIFKYLNKDQMLEADLENYRVLFSNRELAAHKMKQKVW